MGKDLIIGVVDNYTWEQIKYWANSIDKSGYTGHKALFVYNMDAATAKKLTDEKFTIIGASKFDEEKGFTYEHKGGSIMVDRFVHLYQVLENLDRSSEVRNVIATDVRDVIFQGDPSKWLDENITTKERLIVGSENMQYINEPWNAQNMVLAFGDLFFNKMMNKEIYCAGVIAGSFDTFKDFCLNLWLICRGLNPHVEGGGGPDQSAMNIMLHMDAYKDKVKLVSPKEGWVCHAGTTMGAIQAGSGAIGEAYKRDPTLDFRSKFVDSIEYLIHTSDEKIYVGDTLVTILHQWDRVPKWKEMVESKYGDN